MKNLTILELSRLYSINRQTIYNHISKGLLSKNSDGKIDLSEAIRVFGEPTKKSIGKESVKIDSPESAESILLRQQIDILKTQLSDAKDREEFYQNQIEVMQRLLAAPQPTASVAQQHNEAQQTESSIEEIAAKKTKTARIYVPEQIKLESPKRGFLSRFFLPYG